MEISKQAKQSRLGLFQLILSRIFTGLTKPSLKLLINKGGPLGLQYPNSISFCNVLFIGNLCACLVPLLLGWRKILKELFHAPRIAYLHLAFGIITATVYPSLLFYALIKGDIINVVLILRFKGIAYAILSSLIYRAVIPKTDWLGYLIIAIGLAVLIFAGNTKQSLGELFAFLASLVYAIADVNDKKCIQYFSTTTYLFLTSLFSALLFFIVVMMFFGFSHFADAFHGELWIIMLIYSGVGIMLGLLLWLNGIKYVKPVIAANVALIAPVFTIIFSCLILDEIPSVKQLIALVIIFSGLIIAKLTTKIIEHVKLEEAPRTA